MLCTVRVGRREMVGVPEGASRSRLRLVCADPAAVRAGRSALEAWRVQAQTQPAVDASYSLTKIEAEMCIADTNTILSSIPAAARLFSTSSVMSMISWRFLVLKVR